LRYCRSLEILSTKFTIPPFLLRMQNLLRALALVAIVLSLPACATSKPKQSSCCKGDGSCHAPAAKKKAS